MIKEIRAESGDPVLDLAEDTIKLGKQALVFVNTKRSAEKCAEEIASSQPKSPLGNILAGKVLAVLPKPTIQCERLAKCLSKGIAFHHAGLHPKQKELVEEGFRRGEISIICCTTTMAAGVDLPAFRAIIRDLRRYGRRGLEFIPVLEYHQAAGRAGRPGKEEYGEAIAVAKSEGEKQDIIEYFIHGEPENIYSKLAVEPVLRTYLLSLVATGVATTEEELMDFFALSFWAKQFGDMEKLNSLIMRLLGMLEHWQLIVSAGKGEFVSGAELKQNRVRATLLGQRVAQLYLDPLTAAHLCEGIKLAGKSTPTPFGLLQLICSTLEMRPLLAVRAREFEHYQQALAEHEGELLMKEPSFFDDEYEGFISSVKTALMLLDWIEEADEDFLLEKYGTRPGETRYKLELADWLLYSCKELALILNQKQLSSPIERLRVRLKYGVKEELVPLMQLRHVGRVRGRALFRNGIKNLGDIKRAPIAQLSRILGEKIAIDVKRQVGERIEADSNQGRELHTA